VSGNGARPFVMIRPWLRAGLLRHLSPTASRILFLMLDHYGTDGYTWASAKTLKKESGHSPKTIYSAQRELLAIGCFQKAGQLRWRSHNHPGPLAYTLVEFTHQGEERLRALDAKRRKRGDVTRFTKVCQRQEHLSEVKMYQTQEHLESERCSYECPQGVPVDARKGVPVDALKVSQSQEHTEYSQSLRTRDISETPLNPPRGTCSSSGGPSAERARYNGSGNGNGKRATRAAERLREEVRLFLEGEATIGDGLKSLTHWQRYFPKGTYDPRMVAEVFAEVQRVRGRRQA
jgi:hypothetical protein